MRCRRASETLTSVPHAGQQEDAEDATPRALLLMPVHAAMFMPPCSCHHCCEHAFQASSSNAAYAANTSNTSTPSYSYIQLQGRLMLVSVITLSSARSCGRVKSYTL